MKAALVLSSILALGIGGGTYLAQEQESTPPVNVIQISALEKARQATFLLALTTRNSSGSATLVSRQRLENNLYKYRALTAYHVIDDLAKDIAKDKLGTDHEVTLMFQPSFHGAPLRITLDIEDIEWAVPTHDWAAFTFVTEYKLECAEVATKEEFEAMKAFENVYAVGCGAGYGQQTREGIMGATHNEYIDLEEQLTHCSFQWCKDPANFFRPSVNAWYGDSGGAIYNQEGKLIGIINGFGKADVSHLVIALKAHIIHEVVKHSPDFFLVEN
jgi:hypothetical protein